MAGKKRTPSEIAEHKKIAADLHRRGGKTQAEIAEQLGIDQATVSRDLKAVARAVARSSMKDIKARIGELLINLDYATDLAKVGAKSYPDDPRFIGEITKAQLGVYKVLGLDQMSLIDLGNSQNPQINLIMNRVPSRSEAEAGAESEMVDDTAEDEDDD